MKKKFCITDYSIQVGLPKIKKFAFVSDLHDFENEEVLKAIAAADVEGTLVPGDFIHSNEVYRRGIEFLKLSAKICPTFCSLGNHELRFQGDLRSMIRDTGAILLDNMDIAFAGIRLGGLTSVTLGTSAKTAPDLGWLKSFSQKSEYKILLCHHPEYYPKYIRDFPIDLVLSGHAHGGQWRLFGKGAYAPGQGIFPKYTSGLYENRLLVCRGLGNPHIIPRINNQPEIIFLTLR